MIQARLSRTAEATRAMIRSRPATSSVTAVQAHPSRSTRTSEDNASNPALLFNPFEHTRCPKSLHVSDRRNDQVRGDHPQKRLAPLMRLAATTSATSSSVRASGQKDAPIDEHNTDHIHPKAGVNTCSSPSVGVRRHLPWGSLPFDGISDDDRCVPDYLPGTFRSQGFSPSQRFDPTDALWLCFTPHPSLGFRPPEPFPHSQPSHLSARRALLPLLHKRHTNRNRQPRSRRLQSFAPTMHSSPVSTRLALERAAALLAFPLFEAYHSPSLAIGLPSHA
jgi:hypothetical protein